MDKAKIHHDRKIRAAKFEIGDYVKLLKHACKKGVNKKLSKKYSEPCLVIGMYNNADYILRRPNGNITVQNIANLRKWHGLPPGDFVDIFRNNTIITENDQLIIPRRRSRPPKQTTTNGISNPNQSFHSNDSDLPDLSGLFNETVIQEFDHLDGHNLITSTPVNSAIPSNNTTAESNDISNNNSTVNNHEITATPLSDNILPTSNSNKNSLNKTALQHAKNLDFNKYSDKYKECIRPNFELIYDYDSAIHCLVLFFDAKFHIRTGLNKRLNEKGKLKKLVKAMLTNYDLTTLRGAAHVNYESADYILNVLCEDYGTCTTPYQNFEAAIKEIKQLADYSNLNELVFGHETLHLDIHIIQCMLYEHFNGSNINIKIYTNNSSYGRGRPVRNRRKPERYGHN
jgi:hypothetical protein